MENILEVTLGNSSIKKFSMVKVKVGGNFMRDISDIINANLNKVFTDDVRVRGTASTLSILKLIEDEKASRERLVESNELDRRRQIEFDYGRK